jgi:acetyl-CoA C-acetyltransferase
VLRLLSRSQALPEAVLLLAVISSAGGIGTAAALFDKVPSDAAHAHLS